MHPTISAHASQRGDDGDDDDRRPTIPPDLLAPELHYEWDIITSSHPNLLVVGPVAATARLVEALEPHLRQPVRRCEPRVDSVLPLPDKGAWIISAVEHMSAAQQQRMLHWLDQLEAPVQVVCTTLEPMFTLVLAGGFLSDLYYRLNVVLLDVTPRQ